MLRKSLAAFRSGRGRLIQDRITAQKEAATRTLWQGQERVCDIPLRRFSGRVGLAAAAAGQGMSKLRDVLSLLYKIDGNDLILARTGPHADLFR